MAKGASEPQAVFWYIVDIKHKGWDEILLRKPEQQALLKKGAKQQAFIQAFERVQCGSCGAFEYVDLARGIYLFRGLGADRWGADDVLVQAHVFGNATPWPARARSAIADYVRNKKPETIGDFRKAMREGVKIFIYEQVPANRRAA